MSWVLWWYSLEAMAADDAVQVGNVHAFFFARCVRQEHNVLFPALWAIRAAHGSHTYQFSDPGARKKVFSQRPPLLRRSPPGLGTRSGLGRASLTFNVRPPSWLPFRAAIALSASAAFVISTNANPCGWPE